MESKAIAESLLKHFGFVKCGVTKGSGKQKKAKKGKKGGSSGSDGKGSAVEKKAKEEKS